MDLDEELDDGTFDEDYQDNDLTTEQQHELDAKAPQVAEILGPADEDEPAGEITDKDIRDALWEYYFDVAQTVDYLLKQRQKRIAQAKAKRNKAADDDTETAMDISADEDAVSPPITSQSGSSAPPAARTGLAAFVRPSPSSAQSTTSVRPSLASLARQSSTSTSDKLSNASTAPKQGLVALAQASRPGSGLSGLAGLRARAPAGSSASEKPTLASLARAGRTSATTSAFSSPPPPSSGAAAARPPTLSKLQQRIADLALAASGQAPEGGGGAGAGRKSKATPAELPYALPASALFDVVSTTGGAASSSDPQSAPVVNYRPQPARQSVIRAIEESFGPFGSSNPLPPDIPTASAGQHGQLGRLTEIEKAFSGPSPDDVVLNARRGTALGKVGTGT